MLVRTALNRKENVAQLSLLNDMIILLLLQRRPSLRREEKNLKNPKDNKAKKSIHHHHATCWIGQHTLTEIAPAHSAHKYRLLGRLLHAETIGSRRFLVYIGTDWSLQESLINT